jgi:hypothetical protein
MQQTATWNLPPPTHLTELLELFGCADVIAPVDAMAFGRRASDLIRQGARGKRVRYEEEGTPSVLLSVLRNAPPSDRNTMVAAAAASASLLVAAGVSAVLLA